MNLIEISIFISDIHFYGNIIARQQIEDIINISYLMFYEFLIIINNHKTFL